MITDGSFNFFFNGESKTRKEIEQLIDYNTTVSIKGLDVFYSSPKIKKVNLADRLVELDGMEYYTVGAGFTPKMKEGEKQLTSLSDIIEIVKQRQSAEKENKTENMNRLVEEELERQELRTMKYKSPFANIRGNFYKGSNILIKYDFLDLLEVREFFSNNNFDAYYAYNKDGVLISSAYKHNKEDLFMPGFGYIPTRGKIFKYHKENSAEKGKIAEKEQQVFKDWNTTSTLKKESITFNLDSPSKENLNKMSDSFLQRVKTDSDKCGILGKKETENKTDYSEIDWQFIEGLAKRMNKNKEKYEPFNYHKPMDIELLKQSLLRHTLEIMKGNYDDAGQELGHFYATSLNAMMIVWQIKNNKLGYIK